MSAFVAIESGVLGMIPCRRGYREGAMVSGDTFTMVNRRTSVWMPVGQTAQDMANIVTTGLEGESGGGRAGPWFAGEGVCLFRRAGTLVRRVPAEAEQQLEGEK